MDGRVSLTFICGSLQGDGIGGGAFGRGFGLDEGMRVQPHLGFVPCKQRRGACFSLSVRSEGAVRRQHLRVGAGPHWTQNHPGPRYRTSRLLEGRSVV